jgi:hypothetical protein
VTMPWDLRSLKNAIFQRFQIPIERQVLSLDGTPLKQWITTDHVHKVLVLSLLPTEQVRMGISIGGNIKQDIEPDERSPRIWDVANSRILNVQIINSVDFHAVTGRQPPPTPITPATYAALKIPFFEIYGDEPPSHISGAFETVQTVGAIEADNPPKPDPSLFPISDAMNNSDSEDSYARNGANESKALSNVRVVMLEICGTIPRFQSVMEGDWSSEDEDADEDDSASDGAPGGAARSNEKGTADTGGNKGKRKRDNEHGIGLSKRRSAS